MTTKYWILLAFLLINARSGHAQWQQTNPGGGSISALFSYGSNVFAGEIEAGIIVSTDDGHSWASVSDVKNVWSFCNLGTTLFAGADGGAYRSTNNGVTWEASGLSQTRVSSMTAMGSILFAGTWEHGVYRSIDTGATWTAISVANDSIREVLVHGTFLFAGTFNKGVYRSTDSGTTWTAINIGLTDSIVVTLVTNGTALFAGTGYGGAYRSLDSGSHWFQIDSGLTNLEVDYLFSDGSSVFASTFGSGLFHTTDNGDHWTASNTGLTSPQAYPLVRSGNSLVLGTLNGRGIYVSSDNGNSWAVATAGAPILNSSVDAIAVIDRTLLVSSFNYYNDADQYNISRSTNVGRSWESADEGLTASWYIEGFTSLHQTESDLVYAATYNNGVFLSSDTGRTWSSSSTGLTTRAVSTIIASGSNLLAGTVVDGIFKSIDAGMSWQPANFGLGADTDVIALTKSSDDPEVLYAASYDHSAWSGNIYRSLDQGASWEKRGGIPGIPHELSLCGTSLVAMSDSGIYFSDDSGVRWTRKTGRDQARFFSALQIGNAIFAGGDSGIFLSMDKGASWKDVNDGFTSGVLGFSGVHTLDTLDGFLYAGTFNYGLWRRPLSEMITSSAVVERASLKEALRTYPNPATTSSTITITSIASGYTEVSIVDLLGQEITRVYAGVLDAGEHSFSWNTATASVPPGIYECVLRTNGMVSTRPVMVTR